MDRSDMIKKTERDIKYKDIDDKYEKSRDSFVNSLTVLENIIYTIIPHKDYDSSIEPYTQIECNAIRLHGVVKGDHYHAQRTQYMKARSKDDICKMNKFIDGMGEWDSKIRNLLKLYKNSESFKNLNKTCQYQIRDILRGLKNV
jgi:hypothetical protein